MNTLIVTAPQKKKERNYHHNLESQYDIDHITSFEFFSLIIMMMMTNMKSHHSYDDENRTHTIHYVII